VKKSEAHLPVESEWKKIANSLFSRMQKVLLLLIIAGFFWVSATLMGMTVWEFLGWGLFLILFSIAISIGFTPDNGKATYMTVKGVNYLITVRKR
jgi:hypothetical protein